MQTLVKLLKKVKNIAIFSHKSPDPDAIGSALAFRHALLCAAAFPWYQPSQRNGHCR